MVPRAASARSTGGTAPPRPADALPRGPPASSATSP